ncbi:MAG: 23S rRNA (pseudouridine(1915)-N(3))-methyltransferase RlmH [Lachnospiraceae bacterium]
MIRVICVGKIKEESVRNQIEVLCQQIRKTIPVEITEVPDEKTPDGASEKEEEKIRQTEGQRILKYLHPQDYIVCLCIEGKQMTTGELQKKLLPILRQKQDVVFIIGGSLGLSPEVVQKGQLKLSFSVMTFPHQLMRVLLLDQIANHLYL